MEGRNDTRKEGLKRKLQHSILFYQETRRNTMGSTNDRREEGWKKELRDHYF